MKYLQSTDPMPTDREVMEYGKQGFVQIWAHGNLERFNEGKWESAQDGFDLYGEVMEEVKAFKELLDYTNDVPLGDSDEEYLVPDAFVRKVDENGDWEKVSAQDEAKLLRTEAARAANLLRELGMQLSSSFYFLAFHDLLWEDIHMGQVLYKTDTCDKVTESARV